MYKLTDCIIVFFARLTKEILKTTAYKYNSLNKALLSQEARPYTQIKRLHLLMFSSLVPQKVHQGKASTLSCLQCLPTIFIS